MELSATKRETTGKKVKNLRLEGKIPAVIFSKDSSQSKKESENIILDLKEFKKVFKAAGESSLLKIQMEGEKDKNVLINEIQRHPLSLDAIHVTFFEVDMKEEIETKVPVTIINEDKAQLVISGEGIVLSILNEVEVRCLPSNIPHGYEADISKITEIGGVITVKDLNIDTSKVQVLTDMDEVIAKIDFAQQLEKEPEETTADVSQIEVISEKEAAERQAAKEGEEGADDKADKKD